jgi:hypothetical protein
MHTYEDADLKLCRQTAAELEGDFAVLRMHWLVAEAGREIVHLVDRHDLRLAPREELGAALADAGFDARFEPDGLMPGRGLWIGRKREARGAPERSMPG